MSNYPPHAATIAVDFTDGDQLKRITVTDAQIEPSMVVTLSIRRPNIADADDPGWLYIANVLTIASGSFDAIIGCLDWNDGYQPVNNNGPHETITLCYQAS